MLTGSSSLQLVGLGSAGINSIKNQILEQMQSSKEYRHGFIDEAIRSRIVGQITALRKERGWDLKTFASKIGKKLSWAYRLEDPNSAPPTIPSLLEVAETFDIGLDVRFRSFSELLSDATSLSPASFLVPPFDEEMKIGAFLKRRKGRPIGKKHARRDLLKLQRGTAEREKPEKKPPTSEWLQLPRTGNSNTGWSFQMSNGNQSTGM